jgi:L-ascorbate metabolism protein UlaG (beta-lactamase superfamily)
MRLRLLCLTVPLVLLLGASHPRAQNTNALVKITPLGSHSGELCRNDRALLFEDPAGVRILYDPGRTVDEGDPRLGDVHVMLLSHVHTDHIGDTRPNRSNPGTCASPASGGANANSNFVTIAAAKNSAVFVAGEMSDFLARKIQDVRGVAPAGCPTIGLENETDVPMAGPCTATLRPGGSRVAVRIGSPGLVRIATVPAFHSNGINAAFVDAPGQAPGTAGYGGGESGYVITFTNGLVVYLTGDSGMFGDMSTIIQRYYKPTLMVINVSDTATFGAHEAAFVVRELVKPVTVMPSHVNEAATSGGRLAGTSRTARFVSAVGNDAAVVLPLSDVTRSFDGQGRCIGC